MNFSLIDEKLFEKDMMKFLKENGYCGKGKIGIRKATHIKLYWFTNSLDKIDCYEVMLEFRDWKKDQDRICLDIKILDFLEWKLLSKVYPKVKNKKV
jgi:hypothetical protein